MEDFNLPSLGRGSEMAQEIMATMMTIGLSQIIQSSIERWPYTRTGVPIRAADMKSEIGGVLRM